MDHSVPAERPPSPESRASADESQPCGMFSPSTLLAVRRLLQALRDGWLVDSLVSGAARAVAGDAHRHGVRAEQMLIALKEAWAVLGEVREPAGTAERRRLLSRLVTLAIYEYYEYHAGSPVDARHAG
jgi:hypothetical protein